MPDKTSADHKTLMVLLKDISTIGKNFFKEGGSATNVEASSAVLPKLIAKWTELVTMMLPHLAEEETQMITFIKDAFKKEEFDKLVGKIIKHEGLGGAKRTLPSILE